MREEMNHSGCSHSQYGHSISVKERALARSNHLCECCGEWAHSVYDPEQRPHGLAADHTASAVVVCRRCLDYIEEDPITGRFRTNAAEREAALAAIYGQGSDSPVFHLLSMIENYKQEHVAGLSW